MTQQSFISTFEANAQLLPNNCAVVCKQQSLSYQELNQRANTLSKRLQKEGVVSGTVVGVLMERGINLLTSMIAIFKCRGVYMPLDTHYPESRLNYMLQKSECKLLLTAGEEYSARKINDDLSVPTIGIDKLKSENIENPSTPNLASDLAYIIFTSGTTGQPKGVMIEHKSLMNHLSVKVNDLEISQKDRVAETASQCFDISMWQFLSALTQGGTTVILDQASLTDPIKMTQEINDKCVTVMQFVPSLLREFVSTIEAKSAIDLPTLQYISTVGEPLLPDLCRRWLTLYPNVPLLNHYGPTECADGVTHYMNRTAPAAEEVHMPIGLPIANLKSYLLVTTDEGLQTVNSGEVGELYISGVGVARGYINDEEKTASVFINNPFANGDAEHSRLYRTGDLVREREDGFLECLGRADRQVKLRGYRIELNEIENIINAHPCVQGAAVIVHKPEEKCTKLTARERIDTNQSASILPRLVAYIEFDSYCSRSDLVAYIKDCLPEYMLPDILLQIDKLPLNSNGKLDYKALPKPSQQPPILDNEYTEATTEEERKLSHILSSILHMPRIGMADYFLEIGGDSLRAMLTVNRIQNQYDVKISIQELYNHTIGELVDIIQTKKQESPSLPALTQKSPEIKEYPASHIQKHLWFLWQLDPTASNYTLQTALEWNGDLELEQFNKAWNKLVESYETLRIRFYQKEGQLLCRFTEHESSLIDYVDLSAYSGDAFSERMKRIKVKEFDKPFDIEHANLYRATLVKKAEQQYVIIFTTHEIIIDAWSLSTIVRSLRDLYCDYNATSAMLDAPERITFSDFTVWESQYLNQDALSDSKVFWDDQLKGEIPVLALPSDKIRPQKRNYLGNSKAITIRPEVANKLRAIAVDNKSTIFSVILTNFYILLNKYSGQEDIIVGSPHVIREQPGTENLIGFFLNMLPLRATVNTNDTFEQMLANSQKTVSGAVSHSLYPFSWMVDSLDIVRKSNISPVFQVMFNMYSESAEETSALNNDNQLSIVAKELENGHTKYDLTLYCQEEGDAIYLQFSYCKDLYTDKMMSQMLANLETLINNVADAPKAAISDIECLHNDEYTRLNNYNGQKKSYQEHSISALFDQQVKANAKALAYTWNGGSIDYQSLSHRVDIIMHNLHSLGVQTDDKIIIGQDRGIDTIATLLAIVKLNATYIVVNDTYPQLRIQEILDDIKPRVFLTSPEQYQWANTEQTVSRCTTTLLSDITIADNPALLAISNSLSTNETEAYNPSDDELDRHLLQIVYTSGSTGKPKGVKIPVKSCLNRLQWMWDAHPFESGDVGVLQKSATLVASSWEIFGPLLQGVPSLIISHQELLDPEVFIHRLSEHRVTHLLCSPPVLNNLLNAKKKRTDDESWLRFVTSSAENLPPMLAKQFKAAYPKASLYNFYGSSECSSNAAWYEVSDVNEADRCIPIGIPVGNVALAVTDDNGKPLPQGAIGHIDVSGDCLASGYLNDVVSQRTKFHESAGHHLASFGDTVFRTGDLGRFNDQQQLELLGRSDDQVQINGYRVELNEVSNILLNHESINQAATVLFDYNGSPALASYVVLSDSAADKSQVVSEKNLQHYLQEYLLPHVLPKAICFMDALPKLKSGKLDKKALPEPALSQNRDRSGLQQVLSTETEKAIAAVWSELLGIEHIGGDDDFFSLGGSSIMSVRCIAESAKQGLQFTVTDLYDYPILKDLAHIIDKKSLMAPARGQHKSLLATPSMLFVSERMASDYHWNMFGLWDASAIAIDTNVLAKSLDQLARDYPYLTTRIRKSGKGLALQPFTNGMALEQQNLGTFESLEQCEAELSAITTAAQQAFVLDGKSPLLRALWFNAEIDGTQKTWLFLIIHHYLIDGSGFRLLLDEVERYYEHQVSDIHCAPIYQDGGQLNLWVSNVKQMLEESIDKQINYWDSQPWPQLLASATDDTPKGKPSGSMQEKNHLGQAIKQLIKQQQYHSEELVSLCESNNELYQFANPDLTKQLLELNYFVYGFDAYDLILYALTEEIGYGEDQKHLFIDCYDMHRGPTVGNVDLSKVLGMAVQFVPLPLSVNTQSDLLEKISHIHKQRHEIPNHGLGLRSAKTLLGEQCPSSLADIPWPKVNVNYRATLRASRTESLLDMDKSSLWTGESLGVNEEHYHPLRITIDMENNHMRFHIRYDANSYSASYITQLGERLLTRLSNCLASIQEEQEKNIRSSDSTGMDEAVI